MTNSFFYPSSGHLPATKSSSNFDKWQVSHESLPDLEAQAWKSRNCSEKVLFACRLVFLVVFVLVTQYFFICSLSLLSTAFTLLGARGLGAKIQASHFVKNPISAAVIGMFVTVIVQSTSSMISILVGMVAGNLLTVHLAVPMMIGSQVGSSLANALASLGQAGDPAQFRRAFAASTLNDVFNICCLVVLFPVEIIAAPIERLSKLLAKPLGVEVMKTHLENIDTLTAPVTDLIVEVFAFLAFLLSKVDIEGLREAVTNLNASANQTVVYRCSFANGPHHHLFANSRWSDSTISIILIIGSLLGLGVCMFLSVKFMQEILSGRVAVRLRKLLEKTCPKPCGCATAYTVMVIALCVNLVVQSSSVFTSSLMPLVGSGVITLETLFPLILGSNVGTTFTGVLAALTSDPDRFNEALEMAFCQVGYNIVCVILVYPLPYTRSFVIRLAKHLGNKVAKYRWVVLLYLLVLFLIAPGLLFALSLTSTPFIILILAVVAIFGACLWLINWLQNRHPKLLPVYLRSWDFLPPWMRSLAFYDKHIRHCCQRIPSCGPCCLTAKKVPSEDDGEKATSSRNVTITEDCLTKIPLNSVRPKSQKYHRPHSVPRSVAKIGSLNLVEPSNSNSELRTQSRVQSIV